MDWGRFLRAVDAERIESIERRRLLFLNDKAKADILDDDEWAQIDEHDEMVSAWQRTSN